MCAFFALIFKAENVSGKLTSFGLAFTVLADIFLVLLTDGNKLVAMLFFTMVQMFYFLKSGALLQFT